MLFLGGMAEGNDERDRGREEVEAGHASFALPAVGHHGLLARVATKEKDLRKGSVAQSAENQVRVLWGSRQGERERQNQRSLRVCAVDRHTEIGALLL